VPDDDRTRRRLGDATKGRIADLASGWKVDDDAPEPPAAPAPEPGAPRRRTKTLPPPPPGSAARKALEDAIVDSRDTPVPIAMPRTKPPTAPPKSMPFGAKSGPTETGTVERSGIINAMPSGPTIAIGDRSGAIVDSGPVGKKSGATAAIVETPTSLAAKSGPIPGKAIPPPRSGPSKTQPPPLPAIPSAASRLPLPADSTTVSSPPSAVPPPLPPPRAQRAALVNDESAETFVEDQPGAMPKLTVPVGEFDHGGGAGTTVEQDKLRIAYEQSTLKRDAASALLGIAEPSMTRVHPPSVEVLLHETAQHLLRGDPTSVDSSTKKFERGDPTIGERSDVTTIGVPSPQHTAGGKLRDGAMLRRKRGAGGDLRYVITVLFGVRRSRRELASLEAKQDMRQQALKLNLVTLGRAAATLDGFDHPALGPARDQLAGVEDERSQHAGAAAAADAELTRVRRDREARAKQTTAEIAGLDVELAEIAKKLEPLEKEATNIGKRAAELRDSLRRIDKTIAATEASLHAVKSELTERAGIQAEIATLRADRMAVQRDEPRIASELDALNPRIAALESRRSEARKLRTALESGEVEDKRRAQELLAAIGAKRKVVERAVGDAENLRDKILFELGERLYVDRPTDLSAELAPIDIIDVEVGTGERRAMELREILSSVDKAKLARGIGLAVLAFAALAGAVTLILYALSS
jgi:prefoldin subunit 5